MGGIKENEQISFSEEILPILLAFSIFFGVLWLLAGNEIKDYLMGKTSQRVMMPEESSKAPKPQNFTKNELAQYDGSSNNPIYIAVSGTVFDMSDSSGFYGPGGPYYCFAGKDATIGLATMELDPEKWERRSSLDLTQSEQDTLDDWIQKFSMKYPVVGYLTDGIHAKKVEEQESNTKKKD